MDFVLSSSFKNSVGIDGNPTLNQCEAEYFNSIFNPVMKDTFDFNDKTLAFFENSTLTNKKRYFDRWGSEETASQLLILTVEEKGESGGYDAIIVTARRHRFTNRFVRQLLRKLKNSPEPHRNPLDSYKSAYLRG
jgi:hypothetical protein